MASKTDERQRIPKKKGGSLQSTKQVNAFFGCQVFERTAQSLYSPTPIMMLFGSSEQHVNFASYV